MTKRREQYLSRAVSPRALYELKNERNKVNIRWLLVMLIAGYLWFLLDSGKGQEIGTNHLFSWGYIIGITAFMALANVLFAVYLRLAAANKLPMLRVLKYVSMTVDFIGISLVLIPTGGDHSIFFVFYFIVIVSNSLRYGMRLAVAGLFVFNFVYVGVLIYQYWPDLVVPNFQGEVLKVGAFWIVGLYCGYIARRFEVLQGEVEKYQELVRKLMEQKT